MLRSLEIQNFALVDHLVFKPGKGFNVVTGETGAGKTIIFDALGLVLGNRADGGTLLNSASKCIIEAVFEIGKDADHFFSKYDFDKEAQILLRREITPNGKSRSFINDTPASLQQLKELSVFLISIHTQHETTKIFDADNQLAILDYWAKTEKLVAEFQLEYKQLAQLYSQLSKLKEEKGNQDKEHDYRQFLLKELDDFQPSEKDEDLEDNMDKLSNAEEIKHLGVELKSYLNESDNSIVNQLLELDRSVLKLDGFFEASKLYERFKQLIIELQDLSAEVEKETSTVEGDEESLMKAEERFKLFQDLLSKHHLNTAQELIQIQHSLADQQQSGQQLIIAIEKCDLAIERQEKSLLSLGKKISDKRMGAINSLEQEIHKNLAELEMPHAQIQIKLQETTQLNGSGINVIEVLFSANKNRSLQALSKVASGGETSRLALVVKSLVSQQTGTLIFDEIDTGVSGKVAKKVGELFNQMGVNQQVISITHSPQVASSAKSHFYVYKQEEEDKTLTRLKILDKVSQVKAIAEMLSGTDITDTAIANAKTLLKQT